MYKPSGFIPSDLQINSWDDLKPYFEKLIELEINSVEDLEKLLLLSSEVDSVFSEYYAWSYIKMSCDTKSKEKVERYELFSSIIEPEVSKITNIIDKKISENLYFDSLPSDRYAQLKKHTKRDLELFRKENVEINAELSKLGSKYDQIAGGLLVEIDGEKLPMPKAGVILQSTDRSKRKEAWDAIQKARFDVKDEFNTLFDDMVAKRHRIALNAGYENFRDYQHDNYHRFDYTPKDTEEFHNAVEKVIVPLAREISIKKRDKLGLKKDDFRPWDTSGVPIDLKPLKPFENGHELIQKAIKTFGAILPEFGENLKKMNSNNLFDLDSREGKAPGGYNYGLEVTGMPFIFMNSAGTQGDLVTMMHEGGHAMHTFLTNSESLINYRNTPMEMAETASMSMELMTSGLWSKFYNKEDHKRARREHLEGIISFFPWCAIVDAFQHWIYLNPKHTTEERYDYFDSLIERFGNDSVNWEGFEHFRKASWQRQSHVFGVPFYYIEYGIAQLGALQVYRNFKENPQKGLEGYVKGLSLGSSKPLPEVWENMGIKFDFSVDTIKELIEFVQKELKELD